MSTPPFQLYFNRICMSIIVPEIFLENIINLISYPMESTIYHTMLNENIQFEKTSCSHFSIDI